MNRNITQRTAALGLAVVVTLSVLAGLDRLATVQYSDAALAAAVPVAQQLAAAKAVAPRT